jgi:hypothetical protein
VALDAVARPGHRVRSIPRHLLVAHLTGTVAYELRDADDRSAVAEIGTASLEKPTPLGAIVALSGTRRGALVVVRTNYFPAWDAQSSGAVVPLFAVNGQLAFRAPQDGTYDVTLRYPRRGGLELASLAAFVLGALGLSVVRRSAQVGSARL